MAEELLTIKEIARQLDLPESNVRYYRDRFEEFLPYVGQGRKRRYKPEALKVFAFIVEALRDNQTSEEIGRRLAREFPRGMVVERNQDNGREEPGALALQDSNAVSSLMLSQSKVLERLAEALYAQSARENELDDIRRTQERLKRGLGLLWRRRKKEWQSPENENAAQQEGLFASLKDLEDTIAHVEARHNVSLDSLETRLTALEERMVDMHQVLERVAAALEKGLDNPGTGLAGA